MGERGAGRHTPVLEVGSREEAQAFMLVRGGRLEWVGEGGGWREAGWARSWV